MIPGQTATLTESEARQLAPCDSNALPTAGNPRRARLFNEQVPAEEDNMQGDLKLARRTRGFASMDAEKQREIARKGGRSVPNEKRSFSQNHKLASEAGRKGGQSSHANRPAALERG